MGYGNSAFMQKHDRACQAQTDTRTHILFIVIFTLIKRCKYILHIFLRNTLPGIGNRETSKLGIGRHLIQFRLLFRRKFGKGTPGQCKHNFAIIRSKLHRIGQEIKNHLFHDRLIKPCRHSLLTLLKSKFYGFLCSKMVEGIVNLLQEQIHIRFGNMQFQFTLLILAQIHQLIHEQQ